MVEGYRRGRLTAIRRITPKGFSGIKWLFKCDCGNEKEVAAGAVISGNTMSCGCLLREKSKERIVELSQSHGATHTTEYRSWKSMIQRCTNPNSINYKDYGGRGITVCEDWKSFERFIADVGLKPTDNHTIDRINNEGNYEPGNCKWSTRQEQLSNRRPRQSNSNRENRSNFEKVIGRKLSRLKW